jgi:hypothetical protein
MILIKVVPDDSLLVPGFERHTLQCSDCGEAEERLSFSRERARPTETVTIASAPPIVPAAPVETGPTVVPSPPPTSLFKRVAARLRGRHEQ